MDEIYVLAYSEDFTILWASDFGAGVEMDFGIGRKPWELSDDPESNKRVLREHQRMLVEEGPTTTVMTWTNKGLTTTWRTKMWRTSMGQACWLSISKLIQHEMDTLSEREVEVLLMIGRRKTTSEIAEAVGVSKGTVKTYINRIKLKLGVDKHSELVYLATGSD